MSQKNSESETWNMNSEQMENHLKNEHYLYILRKIRMKEKPKKISLEAIKIQKPQPKRLRIVRNGKDGKTPTREELLSIILPLIPEAPKTASKREIKKMIEDYIEQSVKTPPSLDFEIKETDLWTEIFINGKKHIIPKAIYWPKLRNIQQMGDVSLINPTDGQSLVFRDGYWQNEEISGWDRYKTTSTTPNTIVSTGSLTFTVETWLSYIIQQDVIIAYDSNNHMHGTITSYDENTGELVVDIQHKTGSGTYSSWEINLDGIDAWIPTLQEVTDVGATTTNDIEANSFVTTGGTSADFVKGDGSLDTTAYYPDSNPDGFTSNTGTVDGTMTAGRVVLAQDSNTVETDDGLSFNGSALGIGTATPRNTRLDIVDAAVTLVTGTGTISASQIINDTTVTGVGTLFLSEVKVGDLITNTAGTLSSLVVAIASNTSLTAMWGGIYAIGAGSSYRIVKRIASTENSSWFTSWAESSPSIYNTQSGALDFSGHYFGGGLTFFANKNTPSSGLLIKQSAVDGRIQIGHSQSFSTITFQGGNAAMTIDQVTLTNSYMAMPMYFGAANGAGNVTSLYYSKTGDGANQTIYGWTTRYAGNGDHPKFQFSANGIDFGRRDGSTWYEGIDDITLSMDKTSGKWKFGSFGTSTPSAATSRIHIVETNGYEQLRLETPYTPSSTADTNGNVWDIAWDDDYTYVKTSAGWKRSALSTF